MVENLGALEAELEPEYQEAELRLETEESLDEYLLDRYLGHEDSGLDRLQERIAETVEGYSPEFNNSYVQELADNTTEFSKGLVQGTTGALSAPGAIYDGIKEWTEDDYESSISFSDQMERLSDNKTLSRHVGEAAGYMTGALAAIHLPTLLLAGAAHNGRHLGERKIHEKLRDSFYNEEQTAS